MVPVLVRCVTRRYCSSLQLPLGDSFHSRAVHLFYQPARVPSARFLLPLPALPRVRASAELAEAVHSKTCFSRARTCFLGAGCVRHRSSSRIHLYALRKAMPRQPNTISSRRRLSEKPSRPNFEAAYAPVNGPAILALVELMLTILSGVPFLVGSAPRSGRNAFVTIKGPTRLTWSWC